MSTSPGETTLADIQAGADTAAANEAEQAAQDEIARLREQIELLRGQRHYVVPMAGGGNVLAFGLIGDTHYGSLYSRADARREFYALLAREGVPLCLDCGDVLDGHGMYKGQEFEQNATGLEQQLALLEREIPREPSVRTVFITGNHDYSFYKGNGAPVWDMIAERTGWQFVGREKAWVELTTAAGASLNVGLAHPGGGTAYAVSYKSQKYIEAIPGGAKPDILGIGNYHKADWLPMFRNVHTFQVGAFQSQTPFMAARPTEAHVGGWILRVTLDPASHLVSRVQGEFIAFYEPTERVTVAT